MLFRTTTRLLWGIRNNSPRSLSLGGYLVFVAESKRKTPRQLNQKKAGVGLIFPIDKPLAFVLQLV